MPDVITRELPDFVLDGLPYSGIKWTKSTEPTTEDLQGIANHLRSRPNHQAHLASVRKSLNANVANLQTELGIPTATRKDVKKKGVPQLVVQAQQGLNRAIAPDVAARDRQQGLLNTFRSSFAGPGGYVPDISGNRAPIEQELQRNIAQARQRITSRGGNPDVESGNALDRSIGLLIRKYINENPTETQSLNGMSWGQQLDSIGQGGYGEAIIPGFEAHLGQQGGVMGALQQFAYGMLSPTNLAMLGGTEALSGIHALTSAKALANVERGISDVASINRIGAYAKPETAIGKIVKKAQQEATRLNEAGQTLEAQKVIDTAKKRISNRINLANKVVGATRTAVGGAFTAQGAENTVKGVLDTDTAQSDPLKYLANIALNAGLIIGPSAMRGLNEHLAKRNPANAIPEPYPSPIDTVESLPVAKPKKGATPVETQTRMGSIELDNRTQETFNISYTGSPERPYQVTDVAKKSIVAKYATLQEAEAFVEQLTKETPTPVAGTPPPKTMKGLVTPPKVHVPLMPGDIEAMPTEAIIERSGVTARLLSESVAKSNTSLVDTLVGEHTALLAELERRATNQVPPVAPIQTVAPPQSVAPTTPPQSVAPTTPPQSVAPTTPPQSVAPTTPIQTVAPTTPIQTVAPTTPPQTVAPTTPRQTVAPTAPIQTVAPTTPRQSIAPTTPRQTVSPTTPRQATTTSPQATTVTPQQPQGVVGTSPQSDTLIHDARIETAKGHAESLSDDDLHTHVTDNLNTRLEHKEVDPQERAIQNIYVAELAKRLKTTEGANNGTSTETTAGTSTSTRSPEGSQGTTSTKPTTVEPQQAEAAANTETITPTAETTAEPTKQNQRFTVEPTGNASRPFQVKDTTTGRRVMAYPTLRQAQERANKMESQITPTETNGTASTTPTEETTTPTEIQTSPQSVETGTEPAPRWSVSEIALVSTPWGSTTKKVQKYYDVVDSQNERYTRTFGTNKAEAERHAEAYNKAGKVYDLDEEPTSPQSVEGATNESASTNGKTVVPDNTSRPDPVSSKDTEAETGKAEGVAGVETQRLPPESQTSGTQTSGRTPTTNRPEGAGNVRGGGTVPESGVQRDGGGGVEQGNSPESTTGGVRSEPRPVVNHTPDNTPVATATAGADYVLTEEMQAKIKNRTPYTLSQSLMNSVNLVNELDAADKMATPEQQAIIAQFPGWGWTHDILNPKHLTKNVNKTSVEQFQNWCIKNLSAEAMSEAMSARRYSHFTSPEVVKAVWEGVERLGFDKGTILEPAAGSGLFFSLMPDGLRHNRHVAIESDNTTGRVLSHVLQGTEVFIDGYQNVRLPNDSLDLVISNVPFNKTVPFADRELEAYYGNNHAVMINLHNYFFFRALRQLRPGGILAFITSNSTLDATSHENVRTLMAQHADLLGAIRLPNNAFKGNADTEVVTDIIYMQKRAEVRTTAEAKEQGWIKTVEVSQYEGKSVTANQYYHDHPEMLLGVHSLAGTMYRADSYTVTSIHEDLEPALREAIQNLPENVYTPATSGTVQIRQANKTATRPGLITKQKDGYYVEGTEGATKLELSPTDKTVLDDYINARTALRALMEEQLTNAEDTNLPQLRTALMKAITAYNARHGSFHKSNSVWKNDPDSGIVKGLEKVTKEGRIFKVDSLAAILTQRTQSPPAKVAKVDNSQDAIAVSLQQKGRVDWDYIRQVTDIPEDTIISDNRMLVFKDPATGEWLTKDKYATGDVRDRLVQAEKAAKKDPAYQVNVDFLKPIQPKDLVIGDIYIGLGATWVSKDIYHQFLMDLVAANDKSFKIALSPVNAEWSIKLGDVSSRRWNSVLMDQTYGTGRRSAYEIMAAAMNGRIMRIESDGVLEVEATLEANTKVMEMKAHWEQWIYTRTEVIQELAKDYNKKINCYIKPQYDGSHLKLDELDEKWREMLRPHQKNAIWRIINEPATLLAHEVGTGKTAIMVIASMEMRRLGVANTIVHLVPKVRLVDHAEDIRKMYPQANVLMSSQDEFNSNTIKEFCGRIVTGNYDIVVMHHNAFEKIPLSDETKAQYLEQQRDILQAYLLQTRKENGETYNVTDIQNSLDQLTKQIEETRAKYESRQSENNIYFEDLGVDHVFVDESQIYKNLKVKTSRQNLGAKGNQITADLSEKLFYLRKRKGKVVFATGTPLTNSIAEMHSLARYLMPDQLQRQGMEHFDAWLNTYGQEETSMERNIGLSYAPKSRFTSFSNAPEMVQQFQQVADVVKADSIQTMVRPRLTNKKGAFTDAPIIIGTERTPDLDALYTAAPAMYDEARRNYFKDRNGVLRVCNLLKAGTVDIRLTQPRADDHPSSKINRVLDEVLEVHNDPQFKKDKRTQLVFLDLGVPGSEKLSPEDIEEGRIKMAINLYDDMKIKLMKAGVPEKEIAFIHDGKTDAQRNKILEKVDLGEIRILIGSRPKMGAGVNVQKRLIAVHQVSATWRPDEIEQANGRIIRQGNLFTEQGVRVYVYVVKNSFDEIMWTRVNQKSGFITQIEKADKGARTIEESGEDEFSFSDIIAIASGDPRMVEIIKLTAKLQTLDLQFDNYQRAQLYAKGHVEYLMDNRIPYLKKRLGEEEQIKEAYDKYKEDNGGTAHSVTYKKVVYTTLAELGKAVELGFRRDGDYDGYIYYGGLIIYLDLTRTRGLGDSRLNAQVRDATTGKNLGAEEFAGFIKTLDGPQKIGGILDTIRKIDMQVKETAGTIEDLEKEVISDGALLKIPFARAEQRNAIKEQLAILEAALTATPIGEEGEESVALNSGITPRDVWNAVPVRYRNALLRGMTESEARTFIKEFVKQRLDAIRNFAYEGLSGIQRVYPKSADAIIKWGASNTIANTDLLYVLPRVTEPLSKEEYLRFYSYLVQDRIEAVRLALPEQIAGKRAEIDILTSTIRQARRTLTIFKKDNMRTRAESQAAIGHYNRLAAAVKQTIVHLRKVKATLRAMIKQQAELTTLNDPITSTPITAALLDAFFKRPNVVKALAAHTTYVDPLLASNFVESGFDPTGIRGHYSDAWVPALAVNEEGLPLSQTGPGGTYLRPKSTLIAVPGKLAFTGTADDYMTDYADAIAMRLRGGERAANQRQMVKQMLADGVMKVIPEKQDKETDTAYATRIERLGFRFVQDGKSGHWEVRFRKIWKRATLINLAQRFPYQKTTQVGSSLPLPAVVLMPTTLLHEWDGFFNALEPDEITAAFGQLQGNIIRLWMIGLPDAIMHGMALTSRLKYSVSSTGLPKKVRAFLPMVESIFHIKNILPRTHTDAQREEAIRYASSQGALPPEFGLKVHSTNPVWRLSEATTVPLYGQKGILANAITTIYKAFAPGMASDDPAEADRARDACNRALRNMNTYVKGLRPSITAGLFGKVAVFYQTGSKNRALWMQAGLRSIIASTVGAVLLEAMLVKALDKDHRWIWQIPGYKMGTIPMVDSDGKTVWLNITGFLDRIQSYQNKLLVQPFVNGLAYRDTPQRTVSEYAIGALNYVMSPAVSNPTVGVASAVGGTAPHWIMNDNLTGIKLMPTKGGTRTPLDKERISDVLNSALPISKIATSTMDQPRGKEILDRRMRWTNVLSAVMGTPSFTKPGPEGRMIKGHRQQDKKYRRESAKERSGR